MKLNLQKFAGTLTVTVYKDDHITSATATPSTGLAKDDEVALAITPASGYEVGDIAVIAGGVTVDPESLKFDMGEADVVISVTSKGGAMYKVNENTFCCVNGVITRLVRNMRLVESANGAIVDVTTSGTDLSSLSPDVVKSLVASGVLVKI